MYKSSTLLFHTLLHLRNSLLFHGNLRVEKQTHKNLSEEQEAAEGSEVNAPGSTAGSIRTAQREVRQG